MPDRKIFKQFLSHCDNGFIQLDSNFNIIEANNAVEELTGFSGEELSGASISLIFDSFTYDKICSIYECYGCRQIEHTISGELLCKNAPSKFAQIIINCTGSQGNEQYWLLVKNKSFRKEMESKVRKSELILNTALESLPFDFWINDADNRTLMQNSISKSLWGEVGGKRPEDVGAGPELTGKWLETTERALKGEVVHSESELDINGRHKIFRNIIAPIKDGDEVLGIVGMNIDISDLKEALLVRDMLLKEVHHRVKNNLQMISSIINLEAANIENGESRSVFEDLVSRIDAVSLVHEKLYSSEPGNLIRASDYLRDLVDYIISGVKTGEVMVDYDLDNVELGIDRIIILGLIINELVTNSVKYAFAGSGKHILRVALKNRGDSVFVLVADNGAGLPAGVEAGNGKGLGFKMIEVFLNQIGGSLNRQSSSSGVVSELSFPQKKDGE